MSVDPSSEPAEIEEEEDEENWRAVDSGSSDEEVNLLDNRRKRRKHEAIYGVFWEQEDDVGARKNRLVRRTDSNHNSFNGEPKFVRGTNQYDVSKDDDKEEEEETSATIKQRESNSTSTEHVNNNYDDDYDDEDQRRKLKASEHFLALLAKSRVRNNRHRTSSATIENTAGSELGTKFTNASEETTQTPTGLGFAKIQHPDSHAHADIPHAGLGFRKAKDLEHLPDTFGRRFTTPKIAKPDPNIGKWEKYETKGIGSKLLAKMGYTGSGGLRPDSIAQPIAVKLRPASLGLGFGNFKEATSKIAVKPKRMTNEESGSVAAPMGHISALPSAKDILKQTVGRKRKANKSSSIFVPYSDLLNKSKESSLSMPIIDMTGGSAEKDMSENGVVALADELLFNVSFVLNTYENRLQSASTFEQSYRRQQASLQASLASLNEQADLLRERERKLGQVQHLLGDLETVLAKESFKDQWRGTQCLMEQLANLFSKEESNHLRIFETLVPSVLGQIVEREIDSWQPAQSAPYETSMRLILLQDKDDELWDSARKVLFVNHIIPKLRQRFFPSHWNPIDDQHIRFEIVELVRRILREAIDLGSGLSGVDLDPNTILHIEKPPKHAELQDLFQAELIDGYIYEKLLSSLQRWKPVDDKRLDLWVLPWLPFLSKGNVPFLVTECKRHLRTGVNYLSKTIVDDEDFVVQAIEALGPWKGVLKARSLLETTKDVVTPRLARLLARYTIRPESIDDRIESLPFQMHIRGLIDDKGLLSLLEGALLPNMAKSSVQWTKKEKAKRYCQCKTLLFTSHVQELLKADDGVCRALYGVLLAEPFAPTNYHTVLMRRKLQAQDQNDEDWIRQEDTSETVEARVRLGNKTATFREVVEEIGRAHDLLLIPHHSKRVDGKQVFHLGKIPVYFDGDVAYSSMNGGKWEATSIQEIAKAAVLLGN